jgi:chromate reductase
MTIKILAFAGSTRSNSFNQKLLDIAALGAIDSGAQVTHIHLGDYPGNSSVVLFGARSRGVR